MVQINTTKIKYLLNDIDSQLKKARVIGLAGSLKGKTSILRAAVKKSKSEW